MVTLAFGGFGLASTAAVHLKTAPDSGLWQQLQYQFSHVAWVGCAYWDLIQPSFMFMVGVSMAYSYAKRHDLGHSYPRMLAHAVWRSLLLCALGVFLISNWSDSTVWSLMNVLTQIGLGYTFLFLLWGRSVRTQAITAAVILVATWLAYVLYPGAGIDVANGAPELGVTKEWAATHLTGIGEAWHKNANIGHAIDRWLLNLFRDEPTFEFNSGGYQTINFIPSLATMIFGLLAGELLRSEKRKTAKLGILILASAAGLLVGYLLDLAGICPLVKRIWTPSWALFSTGWCCLFLAFLYGVIDLLGLRFWAFPLVVVGMNSIAMYCLGQLLKPWTRKTLQIHLGEDVFKSFGESWEPTTQAVSVGLVFWLVCLWMYRRKIFLRL